jgi:hypothetical protein
MQTTPKKSLFPEEAVMRLLSILLLSLAGAVHAGDAGKDQARKELEPRLVKLVGDAMPLSEALKSLGKQTGNTIVDHRKTHREDPKLSLNLQGVTFWQAIDDIAAKARCGYSLYQDEGALALVDGTPRHANAAYFGICRLAVKRVSVVREEDSGLTFCNVQAELAWEPRFQPFYFDVETIEVQFAEGGRGQGKPPLVKTKGSGLTRLEEGGAVEFEMRLPAPGRACPSIETLSAQIKLIGPVKMLTFRLGDLKPVKDGVEQVEESVKVAIKPHPQKRKEWSFDVIINNPPGDFQFDSYQSRDWLVHNRIYLEKADGTRIKHESEEPIDNVSFKRAAIRYDFKSEMFGKTAGWSLVYRTPGRVVELPASFTLKNILLP